MPKHIKMRSIKKVSNDNFTIMFNEKLTKQLSSALSENGFQEPTPIQSKVLPKINGGLDLLVVGPTASGKSSSILIGVIQKLKNAFEDAPRALIIVPDEAKAIDMMGNFKKLSCYTDLRAEMVVESGKINKQTEAIYFGTDIIIGTAKRIMEIYCIIISMQKKADMQE